MRFDPAKRRQFIFRDFDYAVDRAELTLRFALDEFEFSESLRFVGGRTAFNDVERQALNRSFQLVHWLAGISYFKAAVPSEIVCAGLSEATADFLNRIYVNGLGEFAHQNGLNLQQRQFFVADQAGAEAPMSLELPRRAVIPLGGGKDSLVSVELAKRSGRAVRTIAVGQSKLIHEVAQYTQLEHIAIERRIDPKLFELNQAGAYNGHVPISAILAGIMVCGAIIYGYDTIVMSNEASADAPNLVTEKGFAVNHQYSKSSAFEHDFAAQLTTVLPGLRYFSLLRAWSEIKIAQRFAEVTQYDECFSSCNRNFQLKQNPERRWCRDCPKCRFVFLALAPFMPRDRLLRIFGGNLLDDPAQQSGFAELLGLVGNKPFECVGEVGESSSALQALFESDAWRDAQLVRSLGGQLPTDTPALATWLGDQAAETIAPDWRSVLE